MAYSPGSFVYGLVDPRTGAVRYIGKTVMGMVISAEARRKIGSAHRGKALSKLSKEKISKANSRRIVETGSGTVYTSSVAAAKALGIEVTGIGKVLVGKFKQMNGYRFQYATEVL